MITLSNGAEIYQFGNPDLFLMAGSHGDEVAPVLVLEKLVEIRAPKNVWILPCLNIKGYKENSRFHGKFELNGEYKPDTKLNFMKELQDIIAETKPYIFVDMHEGLGDDYDDVSVRPFIFSHYENQNKNIENKVFSFCREKSFDLLYLTKNHKSNKDCSDIFALKNGSKNCYTTESYLQAPIRDRIKTNVEFLKFFLNIKGLL